MAGVAALDEDSIEALGRTMVIDVGEQLETWHSALVAIARRAVRHDDRTGLFDLPRLERLDQACLSRHAADPSVGT